MCFFFHLAFKINKPFSGLLVYRRICLRLKDCPKNEQLAEKGSFEGNCKILSSPKGIYFLNIPALLNMVNECIRK